MTVTSIRYSTAPSKPKPQAGDERFLKGRGVTAYPSAAVQQNVPSLHGQQWPTGLGVGRQGR